MAVFKSARSGSTWLASLLQSELHLDINHEIVHANDIDDLAFPNTTRLIALMRALLAEPEALLMDEAFSSLDPNLRHQLGRLLAAQIKLRQVPALLVCLDATDEEFAVDPVLHLLKR